MKVTGLIIASLVSLNALAGAPPSLKTAVMGQNFEKTLEALNAGADPNEQWSSAPALYWAAIQGGRTDIMQALIDKGAKVDGTGLMGITPLGGICNTPKSGEDYAKENTDINAKVLKRVSEEKAKASGWLAETDASKFSSAADRAKLLLDNGADPNFLMGNMTVKEWTPFLTAVDKANLELVAVMLRSGKTDPEFRFHQWSEGVVQFSDYLHAAEFVKWDRGDARNWAAVPRFDTPLLFAVENSNIELVKLLVEGGAAINNGKKTQENDNGTIYFYYKSPLDIASEKNLTEIADYLRSKGGVRYQE